MDELPLYPVGLEPGEDFDKGTRLRFINKTISDFLNHSCFDDSDGMVLMGDCYKGKWALEVRGFAPTTDPVVVWKPCFVFIVSKSEIEPTFDVFQHPQTSPALSWLRHSDFSVANHPTIRVTMLEMRFYTKGTKRDIHVKLDVGLNNKTIPIQWHFVPLHPQCTHQKNRVPESHFLRKTPEALFFNFDTLEQLVSGLSGPDSSTTVRKYGKDGGKRSGSTQSLTTNAKAACSTSIDKCTSEMDIDDCAIDEAARMEDILYFFAEMRSRQFQQAPPMVTAATATAVVAPHENSLTQRQLARKRKPSRPRRSHTLVERSLTTTSRFHPYTPSVATNSA